MFVLCKFILYWANVNCGYVGKNYLSTSKIVFFRLSKTDFVVVIYIHHKLIEHSVNKNVLEIPQSKIFDYLED
jgi:hypothetical protein